MNEHFTANFQQVRDWFERAQADGWLDEDDLTRLNAVEQGTPGDLFVDQQARPLVVAFFGGTGVGKSSLLNRLAGADIARVGVERPTSREVTVYVHESVELADLPADLPLDSVQIKRHGGAAHRDVLWIDAPDIDSVEPDNRRQALAWLPHVDLVCYVVSPERYRDDVGWRVLRERGHKHGWMFVLNHWDTGDPGQCDDLARLLAEAGFDQPLILKTCCRPGCPTPTPDEFDQMEASLADLLKAHGVRELTRLGHRARWQELRTALQTALGRLGDEATWETLTRDSHNAWGSAAETIRKGIEWSLQSAAGRFAATETGLLGKVTRSVKAARGEAVAATSKKEPDADDSKLNDLTATLWDDWAESKLVACLDTIELSARRAELACIPLRRELDRLVDVANQRVDQHLRDNVRAALARPGTALGRMLRRVAGFLMIFMPAMALLYVAWAVVRGYHNATQGQTPFLGSDFAIHSALLVLVAWAVPFTADRLLRPSVETTVLRALREGLRAGLADVGDELQATVTACAVAASGCRQKGHELFTEVSGLLIKPIDTRVPALARLMVSVSDSVGP